MRLRPGSDRLHVVLKPKYCGRVRSKCSGCVVNVSSHWQVSLWKAKRLQLIWSTEQKDIILWRFYNCSGSCFTTGMRRYVWIETKSFLFNVIRAIAFFTLIASTNRSRRKRKLFSFMITLVRYMKSWAFYCIKHKDFGNWKIKTDVYVAGLWFLVRFGAECDSYVHTLGCFRVHNVRCMVANYERDESRVLKQFMS